MYLNFLKLIYFIISLIRGNICLKIIPPYQTKLPSDFTFAARFVIYHHNTANMPNMTKFNSQVSSIPLIP